MENLDIIQVCKLMALAKKVNNNTYLKTAVDEATRIIGPKRITEQDRKIIYSFFIGLTAHEDK